VRRVIFLFLSIGVLGACSNDKPGIDREAKRLWGRDRLAEEVEKKAKETIDPYVLAENEDLRKRVLTMTFEEVVARIGFIEYKGVAKFDLASGGNSLSIVEDTAIQHGLHGSFRVLQKDGDGEITREIIYDNAVLFVRNGGGEMRVQGIIKDQHLTVRDEAWQPLRVYTNYYGPRLALKKVGAATAEGRSAARYKFALQPGADLVEVPGQGAKRPIDLSGDLYVDEQTGVPLKVSLRGTLEVPSKKGDKAGRLELALDFGIHQIEGVEIKPKSFVPTIRRHPVDLEPLAFLDGGVRTSTVIGGKKPKMLRPPPAPEGPTKLSTSTVTATPEAPAKPEP
jgi:hypothetical protein